MSARLLEGRRAVVTGASRGIGAAVAERFAAEGAAMALVARTRESHDHLQGSLEETVDRCRPYCGVAHAVVADLADGEDRARIIPEAAERLGGPVDVIVNNAAAAIYQPLAEYPLKRRRLTFEVNVHAPFDLLQAALPGMRSLGGGWVVNVSSATSQYRPGTADRRSGPRPVMGVYGASKAALERLSFAFAQELLADGVRVNTVAPRAAVRTAGMDALMGNSIASSDIEPMEAMVEAVLLLARGAPDVTGGTYVSLELLEQSGITVMGLDGEKPYPGPVRSEP